MPLNVDLLRPNSCCTRATPKLVRGATGTFVIDADDSEKVRVSSASVIAASAPIDVPDAVRPVSLADRATAVRVDASGRESGSGSVERRGEGRHRDGPLRVRRVY